MQPKFKPWHFAGQGVLIDDDENETLLGNLYDEPAARLVAAAPDLYAALRELIERRDRASAGRGERERDGSDGRYARARAALAKAEGRDAP